MAAINPTLIIVSADAEQQWPEISGLLDGGMYQREFGSGPVAIWVRNGS